MSIPAWDTGDLDAGDFDCVDIGIGMDIGVAVAIISFPSLFRRTNDMMTTLENTTRFTGQTRVIDRASCHSQVP